jgi:hypothetical protein
MHIAPNHPINADSKKRRSFVAPLFAAGYGERSTGRQTVSAETEQRAVCERHGTPFEPPSALEKVRIALSTLHLAPLNGLRHRPERGTCGWYIWGGEFSDGADFIQPLHVHHLTQRCPAVLPYLALPPGYRFLIATDYEDVWEDQSLLEA